MKLSKVMALGTAGILLFGTSLFSRQRDNPSWAWASSGAAAANLSDMARTPAPQAAAWKEPPAAVQDARAPVAVVHAPQASAPALAASKPEAVPAARGAVTRSKSVDRACGAKPCRRPPQRSRTMTAEAQPAPALVEPIQFRLADGRL